MASDRAGAPHQRPTWRLTCRRHVPPTIFDASTTSPERVGSQMAHMMARHEAWDAVPLERLNDRLRRRLITGERTMLAHVYLDKGCVVPKHSHDNEQFTYILSGALRFKLGEDGATELIVRAGEVLHIPSNLPHEAEALEDTLDLDVFTPPRQDWLAGTDDYLRGGSR